MWSNGIQGNYAFWVKHYEEGSEYGIDGGKICKLTIRMAGETKDLCNYDRGWDTKPADEVLAIYAMLIDKYN